MILATLLTALLSSTSAAPAVVQDTTSTALPATPMSRLDDAGKTLDGIDEESIRARKVFSSSLSSVRQHFANLVTAYRASTTDGAPPPATSIACSSAVSFSFLRLAIVLSKAFIHAICQALHGFPIIPSS